MQLHDILQLRTSVILPEAISDGDWLPPLILACFSPPIEVGVISHLIYNIDQLDSHVLIHDQLVFCVSPEHPLADHISITAADLDHQDVILFNKDSVQNAILRTRFDSENIKSFLYRNDQIQLTLLYRKLFS